MILRRAAQPGRHPISLFASDCRKAEPRRPIALSIASRMNDLSTRWYSPAPSEISVSRISLDFELRSADLFFREMVVPELGRVWFVRQISWPVAALALHEEMRKAASRPPKPTAICHGIEALACKLEYIPAPQDRSKRILGTRAFGRDAESKVWDFDRLRHSTNYVRNTHRQSATRALRADGGLGFATGLRIDLLELSDVGRQLAEVFLSQPVGQGGTSLRKWLAGWIGEKREVDSVRNSLLRALSPGQPTAKEQDILKRRLLDTTERPPTEKRIRLARALGRAAEEPDAVHIEETVVPRLRQAGHGKRIHGRKLASARRHPLPQRRAGNAPPIARLALRGAGTWRLPGLCPCPRRQVHPSRDGRVPDRLG
jgi:hypothetical protein